nr:glycine-rich protein [Bacteroidia bacterium]
MEHKLYIAMKTFLTTCFNKFHLLLASCVAILLISNAEVKAQTTVLTYSFTGTIQQFTVPSCVSTITMEAWGAQGGSLLNFPGGQGAYMSGVFTVTAGQVLRILVGGQGGDLQTTAGSSATGGGGGSFVALINGTNTPVPWLVAGGGGGRRGITSGVAANAQGVTGTSGQLATTSSGAAGINGNGGQSGEPSGQGTGGPGGGFFTNGGPSGTNGGTPGFAFVNGGAQAPTCSPFTSGTASFGGFGGGGAGAWCFRGTPGGGGGYSGGASGINDNAGGGGGSFNAGTNQNNIAGNRAGNGQVRFTYNLIGNAINAGASTSSVCIGASPTLTASGMVSYTWSTGSNANSIVVTPSVTTSYTASGTNTANCISLSVITITVDQAVPALTVVNTASAASGICPGNTVALTASGATTYTWTGGISNGVPFTPTTASLYQVTGANACG